MVSSAIDMDLQELLSTLERLQRGSHDGVPEPSCLVQRARRHQLAVR